MDLSKLQVSRGRGLAVLRGHAEVICRGDSGRTGSLEFIWMVNSWGANRSVANFRLAEVTPARGHWSSFGRSIVVAVAIVHLEFIWKVNSGRVATIFI